LPWKRCCKTKSPRCTFERRGVEKSNFKKIEIKCPRLGKRRTSKKGGLYPKLELQNLRDIKKVHGMLLVGGHGGKIGGDHIKEKKERGIPTRKGTRRSS